MKKNAKILWISDLHLVSATERTRSGLRIIDENILSKSVKGTNSLLIYLKEYIIALDFTHIVFSGDISFSGAKEQFDEVFNYFIEPIIEAKPSLRILMVPGNHDLEREYLLKNHNKFKDYFGKESYDKRVRYDSELENCFINYSDFYEKVKMKALSLNSPQITDAVNFKGLYGYLVDWEYNLVFIMLNSSWFAWGAETFEKIVTYSEIAEKQIGSAVKFEEVMNSIDLGNLVAIERLKMLQEIEKLKLKIGLWEKDFIRIGVIHHPLDWLHWNERNGDNNFMSKIVDYSDIFLTSHVHAVPQFPSSFRKKTLFFESAELSDFHIYREFGNKEIVKGIINKGNHGFKILEIDYKAKPKLNKKKKVVVIDKHYCLKFKDDSSELPFYISDYRGISHNIPCSENLQKYYSALIFNSWEEYSSKNMQKSELLNRNISIDQLCGYELKKFIVNQFEIDNDIYDSIKDDLGGKFQIGNILYLFATSGRSLDSFIKNGFTESIIGSFDTINYLFMDFQVLEFLIFKDVLKKIIDKEDNDSYQEKLKIFDDLFTIYKVNYIEEMRISGGGNKFDEKLIIRYDIVNYDVYNRIAS